MPVHVAQHDGLAVVHLDHGSVNALDLELCTAISGAIEEISRDERVAGIVLTGQGDTYCAGVDLDRLLHDGEDYARTFVDALDECFLTVYRTALPTVAAVGGHAIAGGAILARACDWVVAADRDLLVGLTELAVGLPFPPAAIEIVRSRTSHRFHEAVLLARNHPPREAEDIGLVDELVPAAKLQERAIEVARQLANVPTETYALTKQQRQSPTIEAIARNRPKWGPVARACWSDPDVPSRVDRFVKDLRKRRTRSAVNTR